MSVKMDSESIDLLEKMASEKGVSKSEIIRRAIGMYSAGEKIEHKENSLESENKSLQLAVSAMNAVIGEVKKSKEVLEDKVSILENTRKQQSVLYERMIDDLKKKAEELKGIINDKDITIAGIRSYLDRVQKNFWYRLFIAG